MKFGFISKRRSVWPAAWLCEAFGVSRSSFHAWLKRGPCARSREDEVVVPAVRASFVVSPHLWRPSDLRYVPGSGLFVRLAQDRTSDALSGAARGHAGAPCRKTTTNARPRRSRRMCSIASSRRTSPTANGLPTSPMSEQPRAGSQERDPVRPRPPRHADLCTHPRRRQRERLTII